MTALTGKFGRMAARNLEALAIGLVLFALAAAAAVLAFGIRSDRANAQSASVQLPAARAAALVAATSASAAEFRAVGEQAQMINASLPFSGSPLQASSPFDLNEGLDYRRALLCLTQAVYYEAGFEPPVGRRAVAQVVLNRMRHPAFPKSVCGVVYQGSRSPVCQFSFVCDGSLYRRPALGAWNEAERIARASLGGYVESSVGAATHYHADYVAPRWAPKLTKLAKHGAHIFYRWPGTWGLRGAFTGRYVGEPQDPLAMRPPPPVAGEEVAEAMVAAVTGPITDGTILKRAPNDVGGIVDVSKGWTLTIPDPAEIGKLASQTIAAQEKTAPRAAAEPAAAGPVIASR